MGTLGDPKPWIPYMKAKECSQRLCSLSACPPWCYNIFSPPPPLTFPDDKSENGSAFSPLVIAIIGILASAFLLVSYYALISKYCGNNGNGSTRQEQVHHLPDLNGDHVLDQANDDLNHHEHFQHEPWFVRTTGLDEGLIKAITLIKYKKGEGLVGSTVCSVCLGEFLEDDTLRLLPKCCHAFHVACIDTWLKSHSNCPLCRANIVSSCAQPPPIVVVIDHNNNNSGNLVPQDHGNQVIENEEIRPSDHQGGREVTSFAQQASENSPKSPFRVFSDLGGLGLRDNNRHGDDAGHMMMIRSFSMDHSHETQISISGISRIDHREVCQMENSQLHDQSLKETTGESSKPEFGSSNSSRSGVLQCVMNPVAMKRSFSSGRFLFMSKHGRGNNAVLPV